LRLDQRKRLTAAESLPQQRMLKIKCRNNHRWMHFGRNQFHSGPNKRSFPMKGNKDMLFAIALAKLQTRICIRFCTKDQTTTPDATII